MRKFEYSNELVEAVKNFLRADDWHYSFDENFGVFEFSLNTKSEIKKINYIIDVHEDEIIVYGISPIGANHENSEMMAEMAEFLCHANYGLKNGCFEFDFSDGEVRFRSFIDCDELIPSMKVIKNSVYCTAAMFRRYAPGIVGIIFAGSTAKDAIAKCEKSSDEEVRSLVSRLLGDAPDGTDTDDLIGRLAARLGITGGEEEGVVEETESSEEEEIHVDMFADLKGGEA